MRRFHVGNPRFSAVCLFGCAALFAVSATFAQTNSGPVTFDRLTKAASEPHNWLTYFGDYSGARYRDLNQINVKNVKDLRVEWIFQTGLRGGSFEATPLVLDGVMYFSGGEGSAFAIDAKTGRELWEYHYAMGRDVKTCCGTINRGLAMLNGKLYMATPDAHVVAIDARNGKQLWDSEMADWHKGYGATMAPIVVKDKIVAGVSGGEFGIRGYVDAFDANTGAHAWRFYTVPEKGEPGGDSWAADSWKRGGGATWMTGTYDPQLNTVYWGVGNPGPDLFGGGRKGDNLYTASLIALDGDTGKLKWHYQYTPHDTHDWDACESPVLLDITYKGQPRKVVVQANRNGFYYVLDRVTGEFLMAKAFARQTWNKGFDAKGRPIVTGNDEPTPEGNRICPGLAGGANWMAPSYNPQTGMFYVPYREECDVYFAAAPVFIEAKPYWGSVFRGMNEEKSWGVIKAIDAATGEAKWEFKLQKPTWAGTLSTSGGLLFAGDEDGYLMAFDAKSGKILWRLYTGSRLVTAPITYMVEGRQYITMPSGAAVLTFALPHPM